MINNNDSLMETGFNYEIKNLNLRITKVSGHIHKTIPFIDFLFYLNFYFQTPNSLNSTKPVKVPVYIDKLIDEHTNEIIDRINSEPMDTETRQLSNYPDYPPLNRLIDILSGNLALSIKSHNLLTLDKMRRIFNAVINKFEAPPLYSSQMVLLHILLNDNMDEEALSETFWKIKHNSPQNIPVTITKLIALIICKKISNNKNISQYLIVQLNSMDQEILPLVVKCLTSFRIDINFKEIFNIFMKTSNRDFGVSFNIINYYISTEQYNLAEEFIINENVKFNIERDSDYNSDDYDWSYLIPAIHFFLKTTSKSKSDSYIESTILKMPIKVRSILLKEAHQNNTLSEICKNPEEMLMHLFMKSDKSYTRNIQPNLFKFEVMKLLATLPNLKFSLQVEQILSDQLTRRVEKLYSKQVISDFDLCSYAHEINLTQKNNSYRECPEKKQQMNSLKVQEIEGNPITHKMIELHLYEEALLLFENGWNANELSKEQSNAMHKLVLNTNSDQKCTDLTKYIFLQFCHSLIAKGCDVNQINSKGQTPISLIKNISLAVEFIEKHKQIINIPSLLAQSILVKNINLAIYLYRTFAPDLEVNDTLLIAALNLLDIPGEYKDDEHFVCLMKVIFKKMSGKEIPLEVSRKIYSIIANFYLVNRNFFKFNNFIEEWVPQLNLHPDASFPIFLLKEASKTDIVHFTKLISLIDNHGKVASAVIGFALTILSEKSAERKYIAQIKSLIQRNQKIDLIMVIKVINSNIKDLNERFTTILSLLELNPSQKTDYIDGKHILFYLFQKVYFSEEDVDLDIEDVDLEKAKKHSEFNHRMLLHFLENFNLDINEIFDHQNEESIFSAYVRCYCINSSCVQSIYKKYSPTLNQRFKNKTTIFHLMSEFYSFSAATLAKRKQIIYEERKNYLESLFNLFCQDYPDWPSYIGQAVNRETGIMMNTSPATVLEFTNCNFHRNTSTPLTIDTLADYLEMLNSYYQKNVYTYEQFLIHFNKKVIPFNCTPDFFNDKEKSLRFFYHFCKYAPLSKVKNENTIFFEKLKENINLSYNNDATLFQTTIKYNHKESVISLIEKGGGTDLSFPEGQNIAHYLMKNTSAKETVYILQHVTNMNIKLLQFDKHLELPIQKFNHFKKRLALTLLWLNKCLINTNDIQVKMGDIHNFVSVKLPNDQNHSLKSKIFTLTCTGLLNYIPNLLKKSSDLNFDIFCINKKIMLCFKPKNFEFESLEKINRACPNIPENTKNIQIKNSFRETLENYRLSLFHEYCLSVNDSDAVKSVLFQDFADKLGVSSNKYPIKCNPQTILSDSKKNEFLDYFYICHQVNTLVYILQQKFLELYPVNQAGLIEYLSSLAPEDVKNNCFLSQVIESDTRSQQKKLSIYGAMMILVNLNLYELHTPMNDCLKTLISTEKKPLSSVSLPNKRAREYSDSKELNKKQKTE